MKVKKIEVHGWDRAIYGLRRAYGSHKHSDSFNGLIGYAVGDKDLELMQKLVKAGSDHSKFMRMLVIYADIKAPLKWWKQYDTYKVGTVALSDSTMHTIHKQKLTLHDFDYHTEYYHDNLVLKMLLDHINGLIEDFNKSTDNEEKAMYRERITDLLPDSYLQERTVMLNYAVARNMYFGRKDHRLKAWHNDFVTMFIDELPHSKELIKVKGKE